MRRTKSGQRNLQDWDIADHNAAGHANAAPLPVLIRSNLVTSACNLETVAIALGKADEPYYAAQVQTIVNTLEAIIKTLEAK